MKKQEIAQKLDEMVKSMPGTFYVHNDRDLNLERDRDKIVSFKDWNCKRVIFNLSKNFSSTECEIITLFVETATVLISKAQEKYTIQVVSGQEDGYLNVDTNNDSILLSDTEDFRQFKARFTKDELEKLKKRKDIHIDWNGVSIDKVESEVK